MKQREIKEKHITEMNMYVYDFMNVIGQSQLNQLDTTSFDGAFSWLFLFLAVVVIFPGLGFPELSHLRGTFQNVMNYSKSSQLTASNTFLCLNERNIHQKMLNSWGTTILGSTTTITT